MIELILNRRIYDNDIGPLMRSFFPKERLCIYADGILLGRESTEEKRQREEEAVTASMKVFVPEEDGNVTMSLCVDGKEEHVAFPYQQEMDASDFTPVQLKKASYDENWKAMALRSAKKNGVKRAAYDLLVKVTGRELPWGAQTGIRPTKKALELKEKGEDAAFITDFMKRNYRTTDEKIRQTLKITGLEHHVLSRIPNATEEDFARDPSLNLQGKGYSLYLGVLFCPSICLYCSFSSHAIGAYRHMVPAYVASLEKEIDFAAEHFAGRRLDSIYFGGGTPTALGPVELDEVLTYIEKKLDLSYLKEFTVEAGRPDSITLDKLKVLKAHGVHRISVNPQTMNQKTLDLIGRHHSVEDIRVAYALARQVGFDCINMDVILGLPGESPQDMQHTLNEVVAMDPENLTVHSLALKTSARLNLEWDKYQDYTYTNSDEIMLASYEAASTLGMNPYYLYRQKNMAGNMENVGFSKPGKEGLYNILIMEEREDILAIGAGAACKKVRIDPVTGDTQITRCENVKDIKTYIERIDDMIERKRQLFSDVN
ncbi:oxygen-independent coproporphyrinogen-3 oxidase [Lachnospiraceae bacterium C10]|nr:oxygen-independent coproporphyrinogen-3 oxidase [Lachnospiraceae bacterium C10]